MKVFTAAHKTALQERHTFAHLLKLQLGSTWYYLTDRDTSTEYIGQTWEPEFILEVGEYEQSQQPTVDDTEFALTTADPLKTFLIPALQGLHILRSVELFRQTISSTGAAVYTEQVFKGRMTEYDYDPEVEEITFTASSVWSDYEKVSGLRTNVKSQSRFDATDQAFRHAANAMKEIPWGRPGGESTNSNGSGGGRFTDPDPELP